MEKIEHKKVESYIAKCQWTWAKTMPMIPHEYIVRHRSLPDDQFVDFVQTIREHGVVEQWRKYKHTYLYLGGFKYWTMGNPIEETTIINRAKVHNEYDSIADVYDSLFTGNGYPVEDKQVVEMIQWAGEPILDIGCGTGLLVDLLNVPADSYVGIDPSSKMIMKLKEKHPDHPTKTTPFEGMALASPEFYAISLYGSPSYIMPQYLARMKQFDRVFAMFYKPDYNPVTYEKTGAKFTHYVHSIEDLKRIFPQAEVTEFNNYIIVKK